MTRSIRNVEIAGHRTSFKLERPFWDAVDKCARQRGLSVNQLITHAVRHHREPEATMSSAVRMFVLEHFRDRVVKGPAKGSAAHA